MSDSETPNISGIPVYCAFDEAVAIKQLKPNPRNPNRHPKAQIDLLAKNIGGLGWRHPITVSTLSGLIVAGHARLEAAKALKVDAVPVDYQDFLCPEDEMACLLSDNRLAELAELHMPDVVDILKEMDTGAVDLDYTGWADEEIERLMTWAPENFEPVPESEQPRLDEKKKVTCPDCGCIFEP